MDSCLILSIPRCGTHLVAQILSNLGLKWFDANDTFVAGKCDETKLCNIPKEGHFIYSQHLHYSSYSKNLFLATKLKGIFITRDPRDQAVSATFGAIKRFGHGLGGELEGIYNLEGFNGLLLKRIQQWKK